MGPRRTGARERSSWWHLLCLVPYPSMAEARQGVRTKRPERPAEEGRSRHTLDGGGRKGGLSCLNGAFSPGDLILTLPLARLLNVVKVLHFSGSPPLSRNVTRNK